MAPLLTLAYIILIGMIALEAIIVIVVVSTTMHSVVSVVIVVKIAVVMLVFIFVLSKRLLLVQKFALEYIVALNTLRIMSVI